MPWPAKAIRRRTGAGCGQALLDTGLEMAVNKGLGGLHLAESPARWASPSPISTRFSTRLEDFSLQLREEQRGRLLRLLEQELALPEGTWEDHVEAFFWMVLRHRNHGILVMTQREEAELHSRLTPERFRDFRPGQRAFMLRLMALLEIPGGGLPTGGAGQPGVFLPPDLQLRAGVHALSLSGLSG